MLITLQDHPLFLSYHPDRFPQEQFSSGLFFLDFEENHGSEQCKLFFVIYGFTHFEQIIGVHQLWST